MTEGERRTRNLVAWGAVGFLFGGWCGTAIAVLVYLVLDAPSFHRETVDKKNRNVEHDSI